MTVPMKLRRALLIAIMLTVAGATEWMSAPSPLNLVSPAEARVGRPLTPVSVAGVARRTSRRCAAGVYYC